MRSKLLESTSYMNLLRIDCNLKSANWDIETMTDYRGRGKALREYTRQRME